MTNSMFSPERGNNSNWSSNAPIFDPVFDGVGLPALFITLQVEEPTLEKTGRSCFNRYPGALIGAGGAPRFEAEAREMDPDVEGWLALDYGAGFYNEGMATQDPMFLQDRIDCFRAAELMYLWAASKGNMQGYVNLGYVYRYDRCAGAFLGMNERGEWLREPGEPFPREQRAYECFSVAAAAGHPEACYQLGDLLREGVGCDPNLARAVALWVKAFDLAEEWEEPTWWGSAALRLGQAAEEGEGCDQSFAEALEWYEQAEAGLYEAVNAGEWYYNKSLGRAKAGIARCRQELALAKE